MTDRCETLQSLLQLAGGEDFRDAKYLYDDALAYVTELAAENERLTKLADMSSAGLVTRLLLAEADRDKYKAMAEAAERVCQDVLDASFQTAILDALHWQRMKGETHE